MIESEIEVFSCGSEVIIDGDIKAFILSIEIRRGCISYQCCWWDERTRKTEWVTEEEVKPFKVKATRIKFL